ncbi:hypothetical protein LNP74_00035 [Klebsiella pneumoniae subsp. pneumoniae]|nr:hypothetical protein [Klebsiella pneumoniae subsp. pneumoniae]
MTTKMISEETLQPQAQGRNPDYAARFTPGVPARSSRWSSRGTMSGR